MAVDLGWPGSRWWRLDLHVHSPASHDFGVEADRTNPDWQRWLQAGKDAGLEAVVVADHNTSRGVREVPAAATTLVDAPVVFPGVELTASDGTHLLFILDPSCGADHIDSVLAAAEIPVDNRGTSTARSPRSVEHLLTLTSDRGLLIIGAHVNCNGGLLAHDGEQRISELRDLRLAGVEVDPDHGGDLTWLDGSKPEIGRVLSQVWSSDAHAFEDVGRRFTWMKMTRPNLDGLRLALLDGSRSVQPSLASSPGNPNVHANWIIERVAVRDARYIGRPQELTIDLNPWLNAFIGGRGTGKSSLVDFCRAVLGREDELTDAGDTSLRAAFRKRLRVPSKRTEEGLLTPATTIAVTYRKDGERFRLVWSTASSTTSILRITDGEPVPEGGHVRDRFPARIYGQKQLFDLAQAPNALLQVIDDTREVRRDEIDRTLKERESAYLSLCAQARSLRAQAADLPARRAALEDVRRKIDVLQQGGHAEALRDYRARHEQERTWAAVQASAEERLESLTEEAAALDLQELPVQEAEREDPAFKALTRAHGRARAVLERLRITVVGAVDAARLEMLAALADPDVEVWRRAVSAANEAYERATSELAEAGIGTSDDFRQLVEQATAIEREISTLEQHERAAAEIEQKAAHELAEYRGTRSVLSDRRVAFTETASNDLVKIEVRPWAERGEMEAFIRETLAIERFDGDHGKLARRFTAADVWSFDVVDEVVADLRALLVDPKRQWPADDHRFEVALRKLQPERIDRLALYTPADAVEVSFRDVREGKKGDWRALSQGSPGQQTAALLAFVLGYGEEPIILDQPEDDLDSTLIYELLVERLRESKSKRQIIVVTHNPNIVVHGDAELVTSLAAENGQTHVKFHGGLQEQAAREEICRVMEGGKAAFESRYRRIMNPRVRPL